MNQNNVARENVIAFLDSIKEKVKPDVTITEEKNYYVFLNIDKFYLEFLFKNDGQIIFFQEKRAEPSYHEYIHPSKSTLSLEECVHCVQDILYEMKIVA